MVFQMVFHVLDGVPNGTFFDVFRFQSKQDCLLVSAVSVNDSAITENTAVSLFEKIV